MFPRLRNAYITVVALVCAVALAPVRGDEPCPNCTKCTKMVRKVVPVADLVVQVADCDAVNPISDILCRLDRPAGSVILGDPVQSLLPAPAACEGCPNCDLEIMCQQPADEPCCQGGTCCQGASCCPNGACCPDGACCPKAGCCEKAITNWTAIAAPEWHPPAAPKPLLQEQLIHLITKTVCPNCWADAGGSCTIDYFPQGMGLVVNAPADVQEQVADLIEALRKLQDLEIACDVRLVAVADGPFQQSLATDAKTKFESGQPVFLDAGELRTFMEALQSDRHTSVLQSPKLTVFNGQKAAVRCTQDQFFVTSLNTVKFGDQIVYVPVNWPYPLGLQMAVRPTVSADHKFVRCELNAEYTDLATPNVPLFPTTTFVTPVFEGGAPGQPVPFTQYLQQPGIVKRGISKSLAIPDGGTAVLYAGKRTKEDTSAEDDSALMFDWIYDFVDLFHPPEAAPTYEEHLLVLVTPRVIHASDTEHRAAASLLPMPVGPAIPAPCDLAPVVRQCAAMADAPSSSAPETPCPIPPPVPSVISAPCCSPMSSCGDALRPVGPAIARDLTADLNVAFPQCCKTELPQCHAAPVFGTCPAMADGSCCPNSSRPCAAVSPFCAPPYQLAPSCCAAPTPGEKTVQLNVCIMCMDPAAWEQPVTAAWSDLSPKACDGKPKVVSVELASRFYRSIKAQGAGKLLAEPRLVLLSGHTGSFLSGGQVPVPQVNGGGTTGVVVGTGFKPYGTTVTFLPTITPEGVHLDCGCELSSLNGSKDYKVTIESPGEDTRTETLCLPVISGRKVRFASITPVGQAVLMHYGRNAEGQDVILVVAPSLIDGACEACAPAVACPAPMTVSVPAPPATIPCAAIAPAPYEPQLVTGQFAAPGVIVPPPLERLLTKYRWACEDGDAAEARKLAQQCLAIDPTCFAK